MQPGAEPDPDSDPDADPEPMSHPLDRWHDLIVESAEEYGLDPMLLGGLVMQESSGDEWAVRPELGFFRRYQAGIMRFVRRTKTKTDDRWTRYPEFYSASYGLCQVLLQVAMENGWHMRRFPTELLEPRVNLRLGAKILANHIARYQGDERRGLLRFNGGGDPHYPDKIYRHRDAWTKVIGV